AAVAFSRLRPVLPLRGLRPPAPRFVGGDALFVKGEVQRRSQHREYPVRAASPSPHILLAAGRGLELLRLAASGASASRSRCQVAQPLAQLSAGQARDLDVSESRKDVGNGRALRVASRLADRPEVIDVIGNGARYRDPAGRPLTALAQFDSLRPGLLVSENAHAVGCRLVVGDPDRFG